MKSLYYVRNANSRQDSAKGFVYIYRWDTGCQLLVFKSHSEARTFATNNDFDYRGDVR